MKRRTATKAVPCSKQTSSRDEHSGSSSVQRPLATRHMFIFHASLAGTFGALSSVVGKLAVATDSESSVEILAAPLLSMFNAHDTNTQLATRVLLASRVLLFCANAFFTAQMWRWYLKALSCGPTPICQILNTGMNFAVSAFFGLVVFREEITLIWGCGALCVVVGFGLVVADSRISPG